MGCSVLLLFFVGDNFEFNNLKFVKGTWRQIEVTLTMGALCAMGVQIHSCASIEIKCNHPAIFCHCAIAALFQI